MDNLWTNSIRLDTPRASSGLISTSGDLTSQQANKIAREDPRATIGPLASQRESSQETPLSRIENLSLGTDGSLPDITDDERRRFRTVKVLGHGAYAWVEEVYDEKERESVAMKVIPVRGTNRQRDQVKIRVQEEVAILRRISGHRHIVALHSAFADNERGFCVLVKPVADYDLAVFYETCAAGGFPVNLTRPVRTWFSCLARGLDFIHSQRIRHKGIPLYCLFRLWTHS